MLMDANLPSIETWPTSLLSNQQTFVTDDSLIGLVPTSAFVADYSLDWNLIEAFWGPYLTLE
jgi:hypothetical protein